MVNVCMKELTMVNDYSHTDDTVCPSMDSAESVR